MFGVSLYYYTRVSDGNLHVQLIWDLSFTFDVQFSCCNKRETTGDKIKFRESEEVRKRDPEQVDTRAFGQE